MSSRSRRAIPLIAAALMALVVASVLFLRSELRPPVSSESPIPRLIGPYTPTFDFLDPTHGWAIVVDYGPKQRFWIFITTDGAMHWRQQFTAAAIGDRTSIQFFDSRHGFAYAGTLYRTVDGGASWQALPMPSDGPDFTFATATRGWFIPVGSAVPPHLYTTEDGGMSWTAVPALLPPPPSGELAFRSDGEGWIGGNLESPQVYLTENGGLSWKAIMLPNSQPGFDFYVTSVRLVPGGAVLAFVGSPGGLVAGYYSGNRGASWRQVEPLPQPEWLADASFLDSANWWASRYGFFYKTSNAGQSWTRVQVRSLPAGWNIGPVHAIDAAHGWWTMVETTDSRDTALMLTSDGGVTWRAVATPTLG